MEKATFELNTEKVSVSDFEAFIELPENSEKRFELINGEIFEVPSNAFASYIAGQILMFIAIYLRQNPIGYVTGEAGGYIVAGSRYAPDVAYISFARQPELDKKHYNPNPPELAVEVISNPGNKQEQRQLRRKLAGYMAANVTVWIVNTEDQRVEVYRPGEPAEDFDMTGTLTAEAILPGFELPVKEIFSARKTAPDIGTSG